ncbi:MAG: ferredoxin [Alphaproteobacteria bacterium]|nr:ferredoxin [Alphaproteobacteria bacterium]
MMAHPMEIRGAHVLAAMLLFFAAVIAINVAFATIAVRTFPGEDVPRSYAQGLQYNETLAKRRAQEALGWRVSADLRAVDGEAAIEVELRDRDGFPIRNAHLTAALQRPTDAHLDRAVSFVDLGDGRYQALASDLAPGRWRLRANAQTATDALDFESDLSWRR